MTREQKLEEALRRFVEIGCPDCNGDCGSANPPVMSCIMQEALAALSAPKAEAVIAERDHYKNGLQILADTFYKGDQHQDYAKHVLDTAPTTSPVPAITDEAVELLKESAFWIEGALNCKAWAWDADQHEAATDTLARTKALLAALPSKGEGE
ncbi:MAG: hypothetical protein VYB05_07600 [Pseudomonadota bacterium]|nr:hypothetical protein [Pseudomonadota bacterium]